MRNFVFTTPKSNTVQSFMVRQPSTISTEIQEKLHCRCINLGQRGSLGWYLGAPESARKKCAQLYISTCPTGLFLRLLPARACALNWALLAAGRRSKVHFRLCPLTGRGNAGSREEVKSSFQALSFNRERKCSCLIPLSSLVLLL